MNIIKLYTKPTNNIYYTNNDIIYKINKSIDLDDCSKYITVQDVSDYNIKSNEKPFVPMAIDISCNKKISPFLIKTLWHVKYYLDNFIQIGDTLADTFDVIPNPEHNKLNFNDRGARTYLDVLEDYYITNVIEDYLNGKDLKTIYKSLPIYCKQYDIEHNYTYVISISDNTGPLQDYIDVGINVLAIDAGTSGKKRYIFNLSDKLKENILKYIVKKYTDLLNDELIKLKLNKVATIELSLNDRYGSINKNNTNTEIDTSLKLNDNNLEIAKKTITEDEIVLDVSLDTSIIKKKRKKLNKNS